MADATAAPLFGRSLSLQPPTVSDPLDGPSSTSSSLHPLSRQLSGLSTNATSARSRTRSIGADGRLDSNSLRSPGTPDISLSTFESCQTGSSRHQADVDEEEARRRVSPRDAHKAAASSSSTGRPRLSTQLRSLITSFTAPSTSTGLDTVGEGDAASMGPKARTSSEYNDGDGQGRGQRLRMPSARPAGLDDLHGFNADSPPLTPASEEAKDGDSDDYLHRHHIRHHWSAAQSLATESAFATTSSGSERASPAFSQLSTTSSATTYTSSRPNSSIALAKPTVSAPVGLLPSHTISPTGSPPPASFATLSSPRSLLTHRFSFFLSSARLPPLQPHLPALLFLLTAFIGSTMCIILALSTLPLDLPRHITDLTITEIRDMSLHLKEYSQSSTKAFVHTLAVLAAFYTWKQSFTIPGSLIMNVVFGAMYGTWMGTLYTSLLTSVGGIFCYLLVAPLGSLLRAMPGLNKGLEKMQRAMQDSHIHLSPPASTSRPGQRSAKKRQRGNIWSYLLVLRVLPIVPYGLMNIACSVLRIPLLPYAVTLAVGSIPWNACTVQVGDLLVQVVSALEDSTDSANTVSSLDSGGFHDVGRHTGMLGVKVKGKAESGARAIAAKVWNKEMMIKLILMSVVSLAPMLLQRWLRSRSGDADESDEMVEEADEEPESEEGQERSRQRNRSSWAGIASPTRTAVSSKRFSDVWTGAGEKARAMGQADLEGRRYPSLKRAVADGCVE